MGSLFWFNVFVRWLHVTSAVVGVGALIFWRLVLIPAEQARDAAGRQQLMDEVLPPFKRIVHSALGLLLLTGAYNFWAAIPKVPALTYHTLYHSIIGTKILLVLVLFGMVTAVLSSSPASGNMQEGRRRWVTLIILLALVILFLSAILRRLWDFR
jgi:putative copper export protein